MKNAESPITQIDAQLSASRKPTDWLRISAWVLLIVGSLILLMPFAWMVKSSLSTEQVVQSGEVWVGFGEGGPQWENYPESLARMDFLNALANTVFITFFSIVGMVLSSSLVGFGFARFRFRGRKPLFILMLSTMMLPPQVTMIPVFVLWRYLGVIDTFWPLVLPMCLAGPFFVFMFRQFFSQIPEDLVEAARIDGASNMRIYFQLMLPLSKPVIAITAIYTFMGVWNDFLGPLIYLNSPEKNTLALALNAFRGQYGISDAHLLMAASFVCMFPCVVLFFAAQRYFIEGVSTSGMKG
ncbi:MAG: carbohydrate ABC transporter permease [Planctomycetota bacterium]